MHGCWTPECVGIGPSNTHTGDTGQPFEVRDASSVHIKGASSMARHGPKRGSMSEFSRNMKYCCTYLLCLRSCAGVDVGECLR